MFFMISFCSMKAQETFSIDMDLKTMRTDQIDFNEKNVEIVFRKPLNEKSQISNTFKYSNLKVNYESDLFTTYENPDRFNQLQNKIDYLYKVTDKTKLNFSLTPMISFQENLGISDFVLLGNFEVNQQLNSKTSLAFGAARSTLFGSPKFIPTLSINYMFNNESTISVGFPDSKITYSNNVRNKFSLTNSFNGSYYNLDQKTDLNTDAAKMSLSQMTTALEYERNVDKNWFLNLKAGYDFNKKYNLLDSNDHKVYDYNTGNGYVLGIGIKYKQ